MIEIDGSEGEGGGQVVRNACALSLVTGKAVRAESQVVAQLPRVVVTGYAQREVAQLPRVTVVGYSDATLLRNATLAAAKTSTKRA